MAESSAVFATPRLASGALFVDDGNIFLVHKTYGNGWDIPGGYVDRGESPAAACEREIREELGLDKAVVRLLVHDWAPNGAEGDKLLYVFDCGELGEAENRIQLQLAEIDKSAWIAVKDLADYVIPRLERRLANAYRAHESGAIMYLEHGNSVLASKSYNRAP